MTSSDMVDFFEDLIVANPGESNMVAFFGDIIVANSEESKKIKFPLFILIN